jgi:hypothetical protein
MNGNRREKLIDKLTEVGINGRIDCEKYTPPDGDVKLVLRPLSDMTDEERIDVFKKCSLFDLSDCNFELGDGWINAVFNGIVIDSIRFIGDNIEMMDNDGGFSSINPISPIIEFYLSKHFDLFGLIEAGLAIDKTTLK